MAVRCGIDLGTTYSAISWYNTFNASVDTIDLDTANGDKVLRSVVYYPPGAPRPVVGEAAWNASREQPERVIVGIKREMGSAFQTPALDGVQHTPPQVSAEILKVLAEDAQRFLGEEIRDVVITVPAYFGDNERAATEEAAKLAGLNLLRLLSEPQAAALGYSLERAAEILDKYLVVYDLGGGTFDVTLVHPHLVTGPGGPRIQVDTLAKEGNARLGGLDWDRALAELVAEKIKTEHGIDLFAEAKTEAILLDNAERSKRLLSRSPSLSVVGDLAAHQVPVTVAEFEAKTASLLVQTELLLQKVIEDAKDLSGQPVARDRIEVLLAGGATRMPMVRDMVTRVLGRPPKFYGNPELLVTVGAAYWAHLLGDQTVEVALPAADGKPQRTAVAGGITDITAQAVGVETLRRDAGGTWQSLNSVIVPEGAAFDTAFKRTFQTSEDDMVEIPIVLYEGTSEDVRNARRLMVFTITGLPPGRPKGQLVEVTLRFDPSGVLRGAATDLATNKSCDIVVDRQRGAP